MLNPRTNQKPFFVGLCMAGAVSAGAYTAGVMDYLLEALDNWEKHRNEDGVPNHRVVIPVMGGASAGGMTSIMAAAALNNKNTPIDKPAADLMAERPENKFYHSWVDLTGVDMFSKMLDISDIVPGNVTSLLNSNFIDQIARRVVSTDVGKWQSLPPYINQGLKVFTTLTNLQGFDYDIPFNSVMAAKNQYHMQVHNDYACFELTEDKKASNNGGWIPLNLKHNINTALAGDAAMATGAFPIGLKSRKLQRPLNYVRALPWLSDYFDGEFKVEDPFKTLNVDGGLINNEPFDKVRDVLKTITGHDVSDDYSKFDSTVLMIEPFPTSRSKPINQSQNLLNVAGLTLSAMISQMRSKPAHIKSALDDQCAGQYLISPSRIITCADGKSEDIKGERAIACGALNGFSGFINKQFRVHDYFLGRFNCKIFLRDYFTIPESALIENPIFSHGYKKTDKDRFKSTKDNGYQIIPVFLGEDDYTFPTLKFKNGSNWPVLEEKDIDRYRSAIKKRVEIMLLNIFALNWKNKMLMKAGARILLNRLLSRSIIAQIKGDLQTWKLLAD